MDVVQQAGKLVGRRQVQTVWDMPEPLRQIACGEVALPTAFHSLAQYREELTRDSADTNEREVWALSTILAISEPIWQDPARPTLRFIPKTQRGSIWSWALMRI